MTKRENRKRSTKPSHLPRWPPPPPPRTFHPRSEQTKDLVRGWPHEQRFKRVLLEANLGHFLMQQALVEETDDLITTTGFRVDEGVPNGAIPMKGWHLAAPAGDGAYMYVGMMYYYHGWPIVPEEEEPPPLLIKYGGITIVERKNTLDRNPLAGLLLPASKKGRTPSG